MICECLAVYHNCKLLVKDIVFEREKDFHKFLLDLKQGDIIDLSVRIKPFKVSVQISKGSPPVSGVLQFILYF
jgi:hypothetical protein